MNPKLFNKILLACALLYLINIASAGGALKVDLTKYEPYPAESGKYVDVWIKVENLGMSNAKGVSIELIPKYPFSLEHGEDAINSPGLLSPDQAAIYKYRLRVDEKAVFGKNEIKVKVSEDDGTWMNKTFEIEVGSDIVDSKGTIKLLEVKTYPEVFMPSDTGTITLTLQNSASQYSIAFEGKEYSMNALIKYAELSSTNAVVVTSDPYKNVGILAPRDTINLTYNIKVNENAKDGTYYPNFEVLGTSSMYNVNLKVPVKVDSSGIKIIKSKIQNLLNGKGKIELDVANTRPNKVSAVSVIPKSRDLEFMPSEYFIGSMDSDELFTIEFDVNAINANRWGGLNRYSTSSDITFKVVYKNGDNLHESKAQNVTVLIGGINEKKSNSNYTGIVGVVALLAIIGLIYYRLRKK
ncbi:MAG: COG1361 S-layer family protein [Methanosarcinales archaeon]